MSDASRIPRGIDAFSPYIGNTAAYLIAGTPETNAERLRQPFYRWHTICLRTLRATLDGRFPEAERLAQEALELLLVGGGAEEDGEVVSATGKPSTRSGSTVANPAESVDPPLRAKQARVNPMEAAPVSPRKTLAG